MLKLGLLILQIELGHVGGGWTLLPCLPFSQGTFDISLAIAVAFEDFLGYFRVVSVRAEFWLVTESWMIEFTSLRQHDWLQWAFSLRRVEGDNGLGDWRTIFAIGFHFFGRVLVMNHSDCLASLLKQVARSRSVSRWGRPTSLYALKCQLKVIFIVLAAICLVLSLTSALSAILAWDKFL